MKTIMNNRFNIAYIMANDCIDIPVGLVAAFTLSTNGIHVSFPLPVVLLSVNFPDCSNRCKARQSTEPVFNEETPVLERYYWFNFYALFDVGRSCHWQLILLGIGFIVRELRPSSGVIHNQRSVCNKPMRTAPAVTPTTAINGNEEDVSSTVILNAL